MANLNPGPFAMHAPLPVVTTRCADRRDRGYLAWVAIANEVAHLQLDRAPINAAPHALEIHVEGFSQPLVVIAHPVGEPTDDGFPLRLSPIDAAHADALRRELFGDGAIANAPPAKPATVRPAMPSIPPPLTQQHRESLRPSSMPPPTARRAPGSLEGRTFGDGRFALETLIGSGASGEVYRGVHTALRRSIAIKVLHPTLQYSPDYCARFYSEALAASQLDHRNVMRILDYGQEHDGLLYIVMELLEGQNLQQILDAEGPLPMTRLIHLVAQACAGLAHAHDVGVVHRDIKPENIVVVKRRDDDGNTTEIVKVCDFGIAHWAPSDATIVGDDEATLVNRPDTSQIVGTPWYMAPEQIRNEPVDARADVYALGIVLYELATGRVPFASENPTKVLVDQLNVVPEPPSKRVVGFDPSLERVILKALEKRPERRQPNARVLRAELRELVDEEISQVSLQAVRVLAPRTDDFLARPAAALAELAIADDRSRALGVDALVAAIRTALERAHTQAGTRAGADNMRLANELVAWVYHRANDAATSADERDMLDRALRVLRDPKPLSSLAALVLDGQIVAHGDAAPLLAAGGPVAARALIEARRAGPATLERRSRFVAAMRAVGPAALPVLVADLEPLAPLATRNDEAIAEDFLRSIPEGILSDAAGDVVVRFVRVDKPSIGSAAIAIVASLWARRALPLLIGVLDNAPDDLRIQSIRALTRLGAVDDPALERFARLVLGQVPAGDEVRVAAAAGFAAATDESRARAVAFLAQRLASSQGLVGSMRGVFGHKDSPRAVVALARSLVALDVTAARPILERLAAARADLRVELENLLVRAHVS